jgi:DNA-binding NarL/FixJ family response regulator
VAVPIRVVVAEDNALLRDGMARLIDATDDLTLVATCGDLDALLAIAAVEAPDVVITDIRMPPTGTDEGIRAANRLRVDQPDVGVVVLSQFASPTYALALLATGSDRRAYLLKDRVSDVHELLHAVRAVAAGGSVIDPKVVEELVEAKRDQAASPLSVLTPREVEILGEMAQGKSNASIAATLHLSEKSIEKHSSAIFSKLGLTEEREVNRRVKAVLVYLFGSSPLAPST